nr:hypothetical protein [Tanacetum cinerariifolium]
MLEEPYVEVALQAPPSLDYIPGPEELEQAPPSPDYDDDMDIEADEEEEEEYPAPTDSVVVASTAADQAHLPPVPMPAWSDSEVVRLLAMSSPPASSLSPWSSPPPRIPFPPLPPILSPPSPVEDRPEVTLPPQKRLGIALGPRYEVGESSSAAAARPAGGLRADYGFVATMDKEIMRDPKKEVGYGITDSWDEIMEALHGAPVSTDTELGGYMREFETRVRQDTDEIYMRMSREAWVRSTDASDLVRGEVMSLHTTVLGQMTEIRELHAADRRRQTVILELLRIDHRRSTEIIELRTALQGQ